MHNTSCTYSKTSHSILSSHYNLQRLELEVVYMTSDSVPHLSHYIRTGSQLKELVLRSVRFGDQGT